MHRGNQVSLQDRWVLHGESVLRLFRWSRLSTSVSTLKMLALGLDDCCTLYNAAFDTCVSIQVISRSSERTMCRRRLIRIHQWPEPFSEGASRLNDHIFGLGVRRCWQNGGKGTNVCTIALRVYSAVVEIPASFLMDQGRYGLQQHKDKAP